MKNKEQQEFERERDNDAIREDKLDREHNPPRPGDPDYVRLPADYYIKNVRPR